MNYSKWIAFFKRNRLARPEPCWDTPLDMPEAKRAALSASLAEYQLGDGGGPCRLIAHDAAALRATDDQLREVIDLWFAEEAEHSRLLGCAVRRLNGRFVTDTFAFRMFNLCRQAFHAQFEMLVLLLVEIVSTGYYRVIRRHCGDRPIAAMCALIIKDETGHINFHRDRLHAAYPEGLPVAVTAQMYVLGIACAAFLWLGHGRCLRALGGTWSELLNHVLHGLRRFLRSVKSLQRRPSGSAQPLLPAVA